MRQTGQGSQSVVRKYEHDYLKYVIINNVNKLRQQCVQCRLSPGFFVRFFFIQVWILTYRSLRTPYVHVIILPTSTRTHIVLKVPY